LHKFANSRIYLFLGFPKLVLEPFCKIEFGQATLVVAAFPKMVLGFSAKQKLGRRGTGPAWNWADVELGRRGTGEVILVVAHHLGPFIHSQVHLVNLIGDLPMNS
jgi:hypothetical protein